ncbi:MAG TPA: LysR family transcriptional regulator, partial [Marinobacter sp.]|nr:LysR family transcriptional regulator [Marinobacter sp.]
CRPARHKTIETTGIMLQMVSAGRGVSALPGWLVDEYRERIPVETVRLGEGGVHKQIWLGLRESDSTVDYLKAFVQLAS